jgi:hypothetical protein
MSELAQYVCIIHTNRGSSWSWSYGSWIYNYICNQCLSPLMWVRILLRRGVLDTTLCDQVCQFLMTGQWFSQGITVSSTNKTDCQDISEILLKVALNTINSSIKIFKLTRKMNFSITLVKPCCKINRPVCVNIVIYYWFLGHNSPKSL